MGMEKSDHHLHDDLKRGRERYVIPVKSGKDSLVMDRLCGMNQRRLVQTHSEEIEREKPRDRSFRARRWMVVLEINRIHRVDSRLVYTVERADDRLRWLVDWLWSWLWRLDGE